LFQRSQMASRRSKTIEIGSVQSSEQALDKLCASGERIRARAESRVHRSDEFGRLK
jgi:hypothetical protein